MTSYIQIEIGGKKRGLKFNQLASMLIGKYIDHNKFEATYAYALIYAGLYANCYTKREDPDFTFEEVCDWCDELGYEDGLAVQKCFEASKAYELLIEAGKSATVADTPAEAKKKPKSTTLKATS